MMETDMSSLINWPLISDVLFQFTTSTMRNDKRDGSVKTNAYSYSTLDNSWFHTESRVRGDAPFVNKLVPHRVSSARMP